MPVVNGINYNEKMITDEELAVVEAMREKDATINVFVNRKNEEEAEEYANSFPKVDEALSVAGSDFFYSSTLKTNVYANYEKKSN